MNARLRPVLLALALLAPRALHASPLEHVSPRDPLAAELRVLELYDLPPDSGRFRLPHFNSWPLARIEIMGTGAPIGVGSPVRTLAAIRIERELQRDATSAFADPRARRSTPRTWARRWADDQRVEFSVAAEGVVEQDAARVGDKTRFQDGSGLHLRTGVQSDRWLLFSHIIIGQLRDAARFTDVLLQNSDLAAQTEDSYLSYRVPDRWDLTLGRMRFQWGPGEEGSLLLSRTAAPLTALHLHARIPALRADGFVLNATTQPGRGEQLAAHRLEWQPARGVRLGVSEAARYRSSGYQGVYLAGVIPYSLAQRLLQQDGDSLTASRNNIEVALDASWRVADGTRVYGEILIDDAHAKTANVPNKFAWQVGMDGAWTHGFTRLSWNAEYTWLSRYVYTSFFGRDFSAQSAPLGFPTGPDARRLRTRITWDPGVDWQVSGIVLRTWKGENDLDEPFVTGGPVPPVGTLEGTPQVTDDITGVVRWWPASGIDLSISAGLRRVDSLAHVAGASERTGHAALAIRLVR